MAGAGRRAFPRLRVLLTANETHGPRYVDRADYAPAPFPGETWLGQHHCGDAVSGRLPSIAQWIGLVALPMSRDAQRIALQGEAMDRWLPALFAIGVGVAVDFFVGHSRGESLGVDATWTVAIGPGRTRWRRRDSNPHFPIQSTVLLLDDAPRLTAPGAGSYIIDIGLLGPTPGTFLIPRAGQRVARHRLDRRTTFLMRRPRAVCHPKGTGQGCVSLERR